MCGIAGIVGPLHDARDTAVERMNEAQYLRGPDGSGTWSDPGAILGHTRLAILDLSEAGHQPMESVSWVLTYNGEIYNHMDLRAELQPLGSTFAGHGDSETLLAALEAWGVEEAVRRLNGMFAFGAWHKPTQTLHLVRDRLGIKPLYYCVRDGRLVFASSPAAIVRGLGGEWRVDRRAVARYLLLGAPLSEETLFEGIRRLEPATVLTWRGGEVQRSLFWQPHPRQDPLDELLEDAIRIRLLSDVPLALLTSGGVDSSVIARYSRGAMAVHLDSGREAGYARAAAEAFGLDLEVLSPARDDVDELMGQYAAVCGEPSMACAAPALVGRALAGRARVCLSANGADELFMGYWRTLHPLQRQHIFRTRVDLEPGYDLDAIHLAAPPLEGFPPETAADCQWFELQTYIRYDLNPVLDHGTMLSSVEARVPFLDHRVVERALSLPLAQKVDPTLGDAEKGRKAPLKRLLMDHRSLWDRPKVGFSLPQRIFASPKRLQRVQSMVDRGVVRSLACAGPFAGRDRAYLTNSLWSLACWYEQWVEPGLVIDTLEGRP